MHVLVGTTTQAIGPDLLGVKISWVFLVSKAFHPWLQLPRGSSGLITLNHSDQGLDQGLLNLDLETCNSLQSPATVLSPVEEINGKPVRLVLVLVNSGSDNV